ncbi:MAG: metal-dependent hydrolase [Thermoplasmatales archaeon]|nr:metal-dependent hydrolase [Thermoplasmatales archaeon]MCW6169799.1 metal-dependent hydrolase [Thermoplasmatales archaeon]
MVALKWLGHAAWMIDFSKVRVLIDPFLTDNPKSAMKESDIEKVDYIAVTHNHFDHVGDTFKIAKRTGAKIVGMFGLSQLDTEGIPQEQFIGLNKGSMTDFGEVKFGLTAAVHSGNESGVLVSGDSKTIYHAGDTALFGDMKYIGELYHPDVALLPIGGYYTMSPKEAAIAAKLIGAKITVPMHYSTFPAISQDPNEFKKLVGNSSVVMVLEPGQSFQI